MIPDILKAYKQLVNIDVDRLENGEEKEVLILIVNLLRRAVDNNDKVFIIYD